MGIIPETWVAMLGLLGRNGKTGSQKYFNRNRYKRYFLETLFKFCFLNTSNLLLLIITKYFYATFYFAIQKKGLIPLKLEFSRQPYSFQLACKKFNKIYRAYSYKLCFNYMVSHSKLPLTSS